MVEFGVGLDRFAVLDEESRLPQNPPVSRTFLMLLIVALLGSESVSAQQKQAGKVPKEVLNQAVVATRELVVCILKFAVLQEVE